MLVCRKGVVVKGVSPRQRAWQLAVWMRISERVGRNTNGLYFKGANDARSATKLCQIVLCRKIGFCGLVVLVVV